MAFESKGKYLAYESINDNTLGYNSSIQKVYDECVRQSKKYNIPLSKFQISTCHDYDSDKWEISFCRPATPEEIEEVKAEQEIIKNRRREEFERMKKEFE